MRHDGACCGNCEAFMRDRFNGDQGACSVIDDDCIAYGTYNWTHQDGDCPRWEPRKVQEHEVKLLDGQMIWAKNRIAELEAEIRAHERGMRDAWSEYEKRDKLIRDMWKCLSAHIESAINDGGCGYPYSPQTRGCGESCTVNGEDCSMSLIERRMRGLGIEVSE